MKQLTDIMDAKESFFMQQKPIIYPALSISDIPSPHTDFLYLSQLYLQNQMHQLATL